jgi:hypothetical protein
MASEQKEKKLRIEVMTVNDSQATGCTTGSAAKFDPDFRTRESRRWIPQQDQRRRRGFINS